MDKASIRTHVARLWDESIVAELTEYIRIPNKSVAFDRDWKAHGHMDRVVARFEDWARRQPGRFLTPAERLPKGLPQWFLDKDRNGNGQITMAEFATDWTPEAAAEFDTTT
ncbi:MAG: hypothetical protein ACLPQ0_03705 [Candidatus Binatus sp.]